MSASRKEDFARAEKEYSSLKAEIVKAVQGAMDILSELAQAAREKSIEASERLSAIQKEMAEEEKRVQKIQTDYRNMIHWSEIFDITGRKPPENEGWPYLTFSCMRFLLLQVGFFAHTALAET